MDEFTPVTIPHEALVEVLFDLGKLRVFHLIEAPENMDKMPTKVFWADLRSNRQYGPFNSIFSAIDHYKWMASGNQVTVKDERKDADVIQYDFGRKERITFPVPGGENV